MSPTKQELLNYTNRDNRQGSLQDVLSGQDVFIGVSKGNLLNANDILGMANNPIILAMANPTPEIMPADAQQAGAAVVGTGRSDFPNQVNNVLVFPGIFRGALNCGAERISEEMKIAAAKALAACVDSPTADQVLPEPLDLSGRKKGDGGLFVAWISRNTRRMTTVRNTFRVFREIRVPFTSCITVRGQDMPKIRNWTWPAETVSMSS